MLKNQRKIDQLGKIHYAAVNFKKYLKLKIFAALVTNNSGFWEFNTEFDGLNLQDRKIGKAVAKMEVTPQN